MKLPRIVALLLALGSVAACAAAHPAPVTGAPRGDDGPPTAHRVGEGFTVLGRPDGAGDAYDATMLFDRAAAAVRDHHCDQAVAQYDRLIQEFPAARVIPLAHYNRGVCLQSMHQADAAVAAYRDAVAHATERDLRRDAWFRVAALGASTDPQRPALVLEATNAVLALPDLSVADRVEALARQAAAVLAQGERAEATAAAERAVALVPTAEAVSALEDDTYVAQARFVLAEATRLEGAAVTVDVMDPQLEAVIERRVGLVLHAHVQFNDAIRVGNADWAAASGFRIGEMYGDLFNSIVNARVPDDWDDNARAVYRRRTSQRLRPLLTGAVRAWEATLSMARRNGIENNEWVRRADRQLQALSAMILNGAGSGAPPGSAPPVAPVSTPHGSGS